MKVFKFLWCFFWGSVCLIAFAYAIKTFPLEGVKEFLLASGLLILGVFLLAEALHYDRT